MSPPLSDEQAARVERHAKLVVKIARGVVGDAKLLSFDELASVGNEALVAAAMRYDPSSGASFRTFAHYRIRGAMIDAIRKRRPARRTEKRALVRLEATEALLREAAEDQQARRASGARRSLEQRVAAAREIVRRAALAVRMSEAAEDGLDQAPAAPDHADPEHRLGAADEKARLWTLVDELDPEARRIVEAIYTRGQSMTGLAEELGVSVATVSRRHSRILDRLGERLRAEA